MNSRFLEKFKRVTDNHSYLPEIDGLRFLAVFLVVVVMHIPHYIDEKFFNNQIVQTSYWNDFVMEGNNGVSLFFVISGFILSLPFARWHLQRSRKVSLRHYYLRRITRIEPPYLIVLLLAFIAHAFFLHIYTLNQLLASLTASIFYSHSFIFQDFPYILPVAWSLEIEVQFYLIAPFLCLIFLLRNVVLRRIILVLAIIGNIGLTYNHVHTLGVLIVFLHFFTCGLLLADLYATNTVLFKNERSGLLIGLFAFISLVFIGSIQNLGGFSIKMLSIFFLIHAVLTNALLKKIFSIPLIAIIGGMCYSIYLVHFAVISALGKLMIKYSLVSTNKLWFLPYIILFCLVVLLVSACYFLLVEKRFMKWRRIRTPSQNTNKIPGSI